MKLKKCDRCGAVTDSLSPHAEITDDDGDTFHFDFCEMCYIQFERFLLNPNLMLVEKEKQTDV